MPTIPCPCCKATNTIGPHCRRCKADLSLLFELAAHREQLLHDATMSLKFGDPAWAVTYASTAHQLQPGDDSRKLLAAAHLLNRDFPAAWSCYSAPAR